MNTLYHESNGYPSPLWKLHHHESNGYPSPLWKLHLYQLQKEAPKACAVLSKEKIEDVPKQYGLEFHGTLHRHKCQTLLTKEGNYLTRRNESSGENFTLSMRFGGVVKHFRLYYDGQHYVGEKKFEKLDDLINDGLVTLYLESRASKILHQLSAVNYRQSPYFTLNRSVRKALNRNRNLKSSQIQTRENELGITNNLSPRSCDDNELNPTEVSIPNEQLNIKLHVADLSNGSNPSMIDIRNISASKKEKSAFSSNESLDKSDSDEISDRPHRFSNHTFTGLHWCGFCGNFLWGLMWQGVKCYDCGFKAHRPCSLKVPNDCCPDLKNLTCIFGTDLSTSFHSSSLKDNGNYPKVPYLVSECVTEIEARGLTVEGIYRVPGSHEQIDALRLSFERDGKNANLDEKNVPDINVVAGLLKLYFRLLPLRLITTECFKKLTEANKLSAPEGRISVVKEALAILPVAHYDSLQFLISHLSKVCEHSAINKMTATSLSTIFGPTLIHVDPEQDLMQPEDLLALKLSAQEPRVIELLIVLHKEVFR